MLRGIFRTPASGLDAVNAPRLVVTCPAICDPRAREWAKLVRLANSAF